MNDIESRKEELRIMSLPKMQEKFREAMGEQKDSDRFWCEKCQALEPLAFFCCEECNGAPLLVPDVVDPVNPTRGLWGMVDWKQYWSDVDAQGNMHIRHRPKNEHDWNEFRTIATPTLALLKALAFQWGVEVE